MHATWILVVIAAAAAVVAGPGSIVHSCSNETAACPVSRRILAESAVFPWLDVATLDNGAWSANLARFEPLVGGRWTAEGDLGGGRRYTAERRYEWLLDRHFVRIHQRLTVDEVTVEEEVTIGWDATENQLRMWSVASDGSFAQGTERPAEGENRWVFEGRTIGGRSGEWRITTLLIDPGSFSVLLEVRNGGSFEPAMTLAYRKVADTAPPVDTATARRDATLVPDSTRVRPDTTLVPDSTRIRPDTTLVPDSTRIRPDTTLVLDSTRIRPHTTLAPDSTRIRPDTTLAPDSTRTRVVATLDRHRA